jgi:hypothetical protein
MSYTKITKYWHGFTLLELLRIQKMRNITSNSQQPCKLFVCRGWDFDCCYKNWMLWSTGENNCNLWHHAAIQEIFLSLEWSFQALFAQQYKWSLFSPKISLKWFLHFLTIYGKIYQGYPMIWQSTLTHIISIFTHPWQKTDRFYSGFPEYHSDVRRSVDNPFNVERSDDQLLPIIMSSFLNSCHITSLHIISYPFQI